MTPQTEYLLRQIGDGLDHGVFPEVHDGGLVWPARAAVNSQPPGQEYQNEKSKPAPAAQSWQTGASGTAAPGTPGTAAPGTPGDTGSSGSAPSIACHNRGISGLVQAVTSAYLGTEVVETRDAVWLRAPASLLPNLGYRGIFVLAIVPAWGVVRGWGFWEYGILGMRPIGPRHTNYGDASICAFDHRDGTWLYGNSLVSLLDLYAVWAVRHLYLHHIGRWPGPQGAFSPFERLREYRDDEWCGCDNPVGRYAACCKGRDRQLLTRAGHEYLAQALLPRSVPLGVAAFAEGMAPSPLTYDVRGPLFR